MLDGSIIRKLESIVGREHCQSAPEELLLHAYDAVPSAPPAMPEAVVFPADAAEVAAVVKLANQMRFPVVPRGAGTNLTGGARPIRGGVVLSLARLDRILAIDGKNLQAVVQPGVVTDALQVAADRAGLFYPPDPQSKETCTIGGNLAENAGGPRAVKYGVTRQYVLALEAVLPTGELTRLGARTLKCVSGYDMVSLLVGSEGTLGVITEATLRLLPRPAARGTLLASFARMEDATDAVAAVLQAGIVPSAIEFLDRFAVACVEDFEPAGLPREAGAVLVIEVDGVPAEVDRQQAEIEALLKKRPGAACRSAADEAQAERMWKARRAVGPSLARLAPHKLNEDIVVPIANLSRAVSDIHRIAAEQNVRCACFGHAGDGNIHANFLVRPEDPGEVRRAEEAVRRTFQRVVELGGTLSGEHGIGTTKQPFLGLELGAEVMHAMRAVKCALDPNDILNPGKIFPAETA
ncbi:MAG: FAD-binding protein [Myxococcales bacterium]|nr:FAD-binding protein [Myxococcales bacterium]